MSDGVDFIREQFQDMREQVSSLSAQIRSLTASINANATDVLTRLTAIESWQGSHEKLNEAANDAVEVQNLQRKAEIREMAVQMGQSLGRFEAAQEKLSTGLSNLQRAYEEAKNTGAGLSLAWKLILGAGSALLVFFNVVHLVGGK